MWAVYMLLLLLLPRVGADRPNLLFLMTDQQVFPWRARLGGRLLHCFVAHSTGCVVAVSLLLSCWRRLPAQRTQRTRSVPFM